MNDKKLNIKEIKGDVNYILFNHFNFGIKELQLSNKIIEIIERGADEIFNFNLNNNS